jgi:hypothetical protein
MKPILLQHCRLLPWSAQHFLLSLLGLQFDNVDHRCHLSSHCSTSLSLYDCVEIECLEILKSFSGSVSCNNFVHPLAKVMVFISFHAAILKMAQIFPLPDSFCVFFWITLIEVAIKLYDIKCNKGIAKLLLSNILFSMPSTCRYCHLSTNKAAKLCPLNPNSVELVSVKPRVYCMRSEVVSSNAHG